MGRFRVYLTPFQDSGDYGTEVEVSDDILDLGDITQALDQNEYNLGVSRTSDVRFKLRNDHGKYLEPGTITTIFKKKINETKVRITWDERNEPLYCGFFTGTPADEGVLGGEVDIFRGIINDTAYSADIENQTVDFSSLGFEHSLSFADVPVASITDAVDTLESALFTMLNQARITDLMSVAASDINLGTDVTIDDKSSLENQTVKQAIASILLAGNSVARYDLTNSKFVVSGRGETADVKQTFYGQASASGIENILSIKKYRIGYNRVLNYWTWQDTTQVQSDSSSITTHGIRKREINLEIVTASGSRTTILNNLMLEFRNAKRELDLETPISYASLEREMLDKVSIDYPTIVAPADSNPMPLYDRDTYDGTAVYPQEIFALKIDSTDRFKVVSKTIKTGSQTIVFGLRETGP